jgi:hypothetical protein
MSTFISIIYVFSHVFLYIIQDVYLHIINSIDYPDNLLKFSQIKFEFIVRKDL